jgi:hypothetical protein
MKYLCLVYGEPGCLSALSAQERAEFDRESIDYDTELMRGGHFIAASALQPVGTASTIRVRGGRALATDGPFAETKEVLCGFIFIEAADMQEARRLAEKIPMARHGSIEVRPELDIRAR